jgi:hypothetical protein
LLECLEKDLLLSGKCLDSFETLGLLDEVSIHLPLLLFNLLTLGLL